MITHNRVKTHQDGKVRDYVSFFQSVTTVGIMTRAKSCEDAEIKAKRKLASEDFTSGLISQTPYSSAGTEEWNQTLYPEERTEGVSIDLGSDLRLRIAKKLCVDVDSITPEDCSRFINQSLNEILT